MMATVMHANRVDIHFNNYAVMSIVLVHAWQYLEVITVKVETWVDACKEQQRIKP